MKTIYLLKNSPKSFRILLKLVKIGDITNNIIIVDKFYSKILRRDKRVKEFPFIINTLPLSNGLLPKIAKVLPFRIYIQLIQMNKPNKKLNNNYSYGYKYNYNYNTNKNTNRDRSGRIITYKPSLKFNKPSLKFNKLPSNCNSNCNSKFTFRSPKITCKKPTIKAIPQKDKSVNIILYNN